MIKKWFEEFFQFLWNNRRFLYRCLGLFLLDAGLNKMGILEFSSYLISNYSALSLYIGCVLFRNGVTANSLVLVSGLVLIVFAISTAH